jgi:hypothetical protein
MGRPKTSQFTRAELQRTYRKRWNLKNPNKVKAYAASRRRKDGNDFTAAEFGALCEEYGNTCLRCKSDKDALTPDHVIPICAGGTNDIGNIQPLCLPCNLKKGTKFADYRNGDIDLGLLRSSFLNSRRKCRTFVLPTYCKYGHKLDDDNISKRKNHEGECKKCNAMATRRNRKLQRIERLIMQAMT